MHICNFIPISKTLYIISWYLLLDILQINVKTYTVCWFQTKLILKTKKWDRLPDLIVFLTAFFFPRGFVTKSTKILNSSQNTSLLIFMLDALNILSLYFDTGFRLSLVTFLTIAILMTTSFDIVFVVSLLFLNSLTRDLQSLVRLYI